MTSSNEGRRRRGSWGGAAAMAVCAVVWAGQARPAQAGHFSFGVGSGIRMVNATTQLKLHQEAGFHLSRWRSGPGLALALSESFSDGYVIFTVAPKFFWELTLARGSGGVAFGLAPALAAGYGLLAPSAGPSQHYFNVKVSFAFKLHVGRVFFYFDPFGLDMYFGEPVLMRYDLAGGLGLSF